MNTSASWLVASLLAVVCLITAGCARTRAPARTRIDVLEMKAVPDGHYLVNRQAGGTGRLLNIKVDQDFARCVASSDAELRGLEGKFELIGNGVFRVALRNRDFTASQWWLFRTDGSAVVKEVPDRGERQSAVPVPDDSLKKPAKF